MTQHYTIKQIEWRNVEGNSSILIASVGVIGTYFIKNFKETAKWGHYDDLCFSGLFPAPDLESCKAAAQAHFEERVKQMLDPVESQWQPIETAPRDEDSAPILLWSEGQLPVVGWWVEGDKKWRKASYMNGMYQGNLVGRSAIPQPTHWMPLSAPPTEKE